MSCPTALKEAVSLSTGFLFVLLLLPGGFIASSQNQLQVDFWAVLSSPLPPRQIACLICSCYSTYLLALVPLLWFRVGQALLSKGLCTRSWDSGRRYLAGMEQHPL